MPPDSPKAAELSVTSTPLPRRNRRIEVVSGVAAFALLATGAYVMGRISATPVSLLPPPSHVTVEVVPSPNVLTAVRDLKRLEGLTDKVTRSAKQSLAVSAAVTAGIAIMLPRMFPGFLDPLRNTIKGQIYAGQMIAVYLLALYLGYRFTRKSI